VLREALLPAGREGPFVEPPPGPQPAA